MHNTLKFLMVAFVLLMITPVSAQTLSGVYIKRPAVLTLGDSIVLGTGSTSLWSFRKDLQVLLGAGVFDFVGGDTDPDFAEGSYGNHHDGHGSKTTGNALTDFPLNRILNASLHKPSAKNSMVLIHLGTNDVHLGVAEATSVQNMIDIVTLIHNYDSTIDVYVAKIIPDRIGSEETLVDSYNSALNTAMVALQGSLPKTNLYIVDMNAAFENLANCNPLSACYSDTIHPNDTGYQIMANTWYAEISQHLDP